MTYINELLEIIKNSPKINLQERTRKEDYLIALDELKSYKEYINAILEKLNSIPDDLSGELKKALLNLKKYVNFLNLRVNSTEKVIQKRASKFKQNNKQTPEQKPEKSGLAWPESELSKKRKKDYQQQTKVDKPQTIGLEPTHISNRPSPEELKNLTKDLKLNKPKQNTSLTKDLKLNKPKEPSIDRKQHAMDLFDEKINKFSSTIQKEKEQIKSLKQSLKTVSSPKDKQEIESEIVGRRNSIKKQQREISKYKKAKERFLSMLQEIIKGK